MRELRGGLPLKTDPVESDVEVMEVTISIDDPLERLDYLKPRGLAPSEMRGDQGHLGQCSDFVGIQVAANPCLEHAECPRRDVVPQVWCGVTNTCVLSNVARRMSRPDQLGSRESGKGALPLDALLNPELAEERPIACVWDDVSEDPAHHLEVAPASRRSLHVAQRDQGLGELPRFQETSVEN